MGELTVHAGTANEADRELQRWLEQHTRLLAHEHGWVVHRFRPVPPRAVRADLPARAGSDFRLTTLIEGQVDGGIVARQLAERLAAGDERGADRVVDRFVVEAREQIRIHDRVIVSAVGFGRLLHDRVPRFVEALDRLTRHHQVRVVLTHFDRSPADDTIADWIATLGPAIEVDLIDRNDLLPLGVSLVKYFVESVLGLPFDGPRGLTVPPAVTDPDLSSGLDPDPEEPPTLDGRREFPPLLDLGCGSGHNLRTAPTRFGVDGCGIDWSRRAVLAARQQGFDVMLGDITQLDPASIRGVEYVLLDNVLEHLSSLDEVRQVLRVACEIAGRGVFLRQPSFESVDELAQVGCKLYWTDWPSDHSTPVTIEHIRTIAEEIGVRSVGVVDVGSIGSSNDGAVLPYGVGPDQYPPAGSTDVYDAVIHGPRPHIDFSFPVHRCHDLFIVTGTGSVCFDYPGDPAANTARPQVVWSGEPGSLTASVAGVPLLAGGARDLPLAARAPVGGSDPSHPVVAVPRPPDRDQWDWSAPMLHPADARLIDLGSGLGGSLTIAQERFATLGVGIEIDTDRVSQARRSGLSCYQGDLRTLRAEDFPAAEYVVLDNVLEHLPTVHEVDMVLALAIRMAKRMVVIRHPSFENIDYLAAHGLKLYWTDWPSAHTAPMRLHELTQMTSRHGAYRMIVRPEKQILDSLDTAVLPSGAPPDQKRTHRDDPTVYDELRHGPKPVVVFDRPVFSTFEILLLTGPGTVEIAAAEAVPELAWRRTPGQIAPNWVERLHRGRGADVRVIEEDNRVFVVENQMLRLVSSALVGRALQLHFGRSSLEPGERSKLADGPPVVQLKVPGETSFVIVGGQRLRLPRLPVTMQMSPEDAHEFEWGTTLDTFGAATQLHNERQDRRGHAVATSSSV